MIIEGKECDYSQNQKVMKPTTAKDVKQYLNGLTKDNLISGILDLYRKVDSVKDYYHSKLNKDDNQVIDKYKSIIKSEFFSGAAKLSTAKKAISDYKKISNSKEGLIELMLYYVEVGVQFTTTYGDIDAPFYNSMGSTFKKAVELIVENKLVEEYESRCKMIVENTSDMGWGFHDELSYTYKKYLE